MKNTFNKDFNLTFWKIFGVNHRVYKASDILNIKRDKQADEKIYNNFMKNDEKLSNKEFLIFNTKEADDFWELFRVYLSGSNENINFYINQLNNITYNFKIFKKTNFIEYNYLDLFSFQIATILEQMHDMQYDTNLFFDAIKEESIFPFLDDCKKENKIEGNKQLSIELSYILDEIIENLSKKYENNIVKITDSTFQKKISNWKKRKELPSLINILTISKVRFKNRETDDRKYIYFFQFLIARALIYIYKEYNIDEETKNNFLNRLQFFRDEIHSTYNLENKNKNFETLQEKYLIDISTIIDTAGSINNAFGLLENKLKPLKNNMSIEDDERIITMPNRNEIIRFFNEKNYNKISELLVCDDTNDFADVILKYISYLKLLIAIKLEDKTLIKKSYKDFDRKFLGGMLSMLNTKYNSQELIDMFKDIKTFEECVVQMNIYLNKKLSTLE